MSESLANALDIAVPYLPPDLIEPAAVPDLYWVAGHLPPVHRMVFEARLRADCRQVDLAQCFAGEGQEAGVCAAWLAELAASPKCAEPQAWQRLAALFAHWGEPSSLMHQAVREMWLECDVLGSTKALPLPSMFFGLRPDLPKDRSYVAACAVLDLLLDASHLVAVQDGLECCWDACGEGVRPNEVGVMLSRQTQALRFCVQLRGWHEGVAYLRRVGWPGDVGDLDRAVAEMRGGAGGPMMLALDVGRCIQPRLGLELSFGQRRGEVPAHTALLESLVARQLCTAAKRDALLTWPGIVKPTEIDCPWPDSLISQSLVQPAGWFSTFVRRVSHVKLVYEPARILEAKGYLLFGHDWLLSQEPVDE